MRKTTDQKGHGLVGGVIVTVLVASPGVIILGVLLALFQRIKEIRKGEEDDAKNY